jgi:hypothetical protein
MTGLTANLDARVIATEWEMMGNAARVTTLEAAAAHTSSEIVNLSGSIKNKISEIGARMGSIGLGAATSVGNHLRGNHSWNTR